MGAVVVGTNRYIDREIDKIPRVEVATVPATGSGTNFLIIGSDTRSFVSNQAEEQAFGSVATDGPARSDTMMVLHADGEHSYVVSFPRDLWVPIPGRGTMKINAAFNDGPQKVIDTLKQDFGVDINHYLEVDFKTFQEIVDAVGTVNVYLPYAARDKLSGLFTLWGGCIPLNGGQALAYVRSRHLEYYIDNRWTDASGLSDIDRIGRQQQFMRKLGALAVRKLLADPATAPGLADKVIPLLTADTSFGRTAFNELVQAFMGAGDAGGGPTFATLPWVEATRDGQSVLLVKQPDADTMLAVLRGQAPVPTPAATTTPGGTTPPAALRPADVRVQVLNASGVQGAAASASEALIHLGFVSGGTGNDPRGLIDHSEVRYRPGDEAKAQLVAASVPGAQLVADPSLSGTDVVVALGKSFQGVKSTSTTTAPAAATTTTLSPEQACQ